MGDTKGYETHCLCRKPRPWGGTGNVCLNCGWPIESAGKTAEDKGGATQGTGKNSCPPTFSIKRTDQGADTSEGASLAPDLTDYVIGIREWYIWDGDDDPKKLRSIYISEYHWHGGLRRCRNMKVGSTHTIPAT